MPEFIKKVSQKFDIKTQIFFVFEKIMSWENSGSGQFFQK